MEPELERELDDGYERLSSCESVAEARELYERLPKSQEVAAQWRAILRRAADVILGRLERAQASPKPSPPTSDEQDTSPDGPPTEQT